jgi:ribonuclease P protein component
LSIKRSFRLTRSTDFLRVRQSGKSFAHPLIVLITLPNQLDKPRVGVVAGKAIGKAVQRNRAKRLLRTAIWTHLATILPGWDIVLIARRPMTQANFVQTQAAIAVLLHRAKLVQDPHE